MSDAGLMPARSLRLMVVVLSVLVVMGVSAARAAALPVWDVAVHHGPSVFQQGGPAVYTVMVRNLGDTAADQSLDPVSLQIDLPAGVTTRIQNTIFGGQVTWFGGVSNSWTCSDSSAEISQLNCQPTQNLIAPGDASLSELRVYVAVDPDAEGPLALQATVSGGGASTVSKSASVDLGPMPSAFGALPDSIIADAFDAQNVPVRQAGEHPRRAELSFDLATRQQGIPLFGFGPPISSTIPTGKMRDVEVTLPRGLVGNPQAIPVRCTYRQFAFGTSLANLCPVQSQVGIIAIDKKSFNGLFYPDIVSPLQPIYLLEPNPGDLATLGFTVNGRNVFIHARLDPRDYSIETIAEDIPETVGVLFQTADLWGNPSDPIHDAERMDTEPKNGELPKWGAPYGVETPPFISVGTECNVEDTTDVTITQWSDERARYGPLSSAPVALSGCNRLEFSPSIESRPTTNLADAPSGLEFHLNIPQNEDPDGLATSQLRDAKVVLPPGFTVNPPSADGLGACSMDQVGVSPSGVPDGDPVECPDASKLGSVEAISPALEDPIRGSVYLATQNQNPFNSLLALYIVLEDKERGLLVKLPGRVDLDPNTGRLTTVFQNNPQLPVEDLELLTKGGPRAPLKTPATCGVHTVESALTPWAAPELASVDRSSSFELTQGPGGGACLKAGGEAPNSPKFSAGTADPTAKAFAPFVLKLSREDGSQPLKAIDTTLPKGLLGKLAGISYCSDSALGAAAAKSGRAEQGSPSCPASSQVGSVNVGAGAGSTPLYVGGNAYLAGPYKGAPLSLAIVTPAVAGPFDLGTVVVRTALYVNPETAQIHAVSDALPTILQGIPLDIRSVALKMDRPSFTLNPTSCDPMSVLGSATSVFDQTASLTSPFQVGECNLLGFKPELGLKFFGPTQRTGHPRLRAELTARPGDANIGKAVVTLPKTELLENAHIKTICTRVQYRADDCPAQSIYGNAWAWSPLLDQPLQGPVYLRSSDNKLPDLVASLDGQIHIDLVGRIDSVDARIRNTFEEVPDAPVSKFVLEMQGGKKGLLVNNTQLCRAKPRAGVSLDAQNGKTYDTNPLVKVVDCKKAKAKKHGKRGAKKRG